MCNCHTVGFHNARNAHFSLALLMNFDKPFKEATPKKCAEFHTWRILVDFYVEHFFESDCCGGHHFLIRHSSQLGEHN